MRRKNLVPRPEKAEWPANCKEMRQLLKESLDRIEADCGLFSLHPAYELLLRYERVLEEREAKRKQRIKEVEEECSQQKNTAG